MIAPPLAVPLLEADRHYPGVTPTPASVGQVEAVERRLTALMTALCKSLENRIARLEASNAIARDDRPDREIVIETLESLLERLR